MDEPGIFRGTDRFVVDGRLGRGAMGVVYEAFDRERNMRVALKTLRAPDPTALYRFKREFRALADVAHENLISLHELFSVDGQWFFTMEIVDGVDWLSYVRDGFPAFAQGTEPRSAAAGTAAETAATETIGGATADTEVQTMPDRPGSARSGSASASGSGSGSSAGRPSSSKQRPPLVTPQQFARLRASLRQLVAGVAALHRAGHIHRDIKPSNVMVTREERVILLDFGVVAELGQQRRSAAEKRLIGTPVYMAPEQASGVPLTEASDWYSVGVMLWEALIGRQPFSGPTEKVIEEKQRVEPSPPRALNPEVPADLGELCCQLLHIDPARRPTDRELVDRLGIRDEAAIAPATGGQDLDEAPVLVGRYRHLQALREALRETERGVGSTVHVHGASGMGKSALIASFLDEVAAGYPDAVVLTGRCYERESMPYKAVDSLIDSLSRYLTDLSDDDVDTLLPRDILLLARMFPVLRRVEAIAKRQRGTAATPDPQQLRQRAFVALRELLTGIALRRPLILFIDDLQWGDIDSAPLLDSLTRPPNPPPLLLIVSYRSEDAEQSPLLRALRERPTVGPGAIVRELPVAALDPDESRRLAAELLARVDAPADSADTIARESGGSPYFIDELVRYAGTVAHHAATTAGELTLEGVIRARVGSLPRRTRRLLEVVAVAGMPTEQGIVQRAAEIDDVERSTMFQALRAARLVRLSGARDDDLIETYHDRIRVTLVTAMPESVRRAHHYRIARAVQASDRPDAEVLATHFRAAGDEAAAAEYAVQAADQAARALAFERAAELYRAALELQPPAGDERRELEIKLGHALANAGRGPEAARAYLQAARGGGDSQAQTLELQRLAAMQFLSSGYIDEGLEVLRTVLAAVGLKLPKRGTRSVVSFLLRRAHLRVRGLRYRTRDPSESRAADLLRTDVCWSAATGLTMVDPILAADFQARYLILALRSGDELRIGRGLAMEASHLSAAGGRAAARCERLLDAADEIAQRLERPYLDGLISLSRGGVAFLMGRWKAAHTSCARAEEVFRTHCTGVTWELNTTYAFMMWPLFHLGEFAEIARRAPALLEEARARGDLHAFQNQATWIRPVVGIGADEPERALAELDELIAEMDPNEFHLQHLNAILGKMLLLMYLGDGDTAWKLINDSWPALRRSMLLTVQQIRVCMLLLRAMAAMAVARTADDSKPLVRRARRDARKILSENMPWATAMGHMIQADVAMFGDDPDRAAALLHDAARGFRAADMMVYATSCERRLGQLIGGGEGAALIRGADEFMTGQGIVNPARAAAAFVSLAGREP